MGSSIRGGGRLQRGHGSWLWASILMCGLGYGGGCGSEESNLPKGMVVKGTSEHEAPNLPENSSSSEASASETAEGSESTPSGDTEEEFETSALENTTGRSPQPCADGDNDGVCDLEDICSVGSDADVDQNGVPDACEVELLNHRFDEQSVSVGVHHTAHFSLGFPTTATMGCAVQVIGESETWGDGQTGQHRYSWTEGGQARTVLDCLRDSFDDMVCFRLHFNEDSVQEECLRESTLDMGALMQVESITVVELEVHSVDIYHGDGDTGVGGRATWRVLGQR